MFAPITVMYRPRFARIVVYMLQATEYNVSAYLRWFWRTTDFREVIYRKDLVFTRPSRMLLKTLQLGMSLQVILAICLGVWGINHNTNVILPLAVALLLSTPILWGHLIVLPLLAGRYLIIKPYYRYKIWKSRMLFSKHPGTRIAVAGSYGKTTMKEILLTVLSEGKKVAATPATKNVPISHAKFAQSLKGDEEILIIEYGEGAPGDIQKFNNYIRPHKGIITGLAPAHLDRYKSLDSIYEDFISLVKYLDKKDVYVNYDSEALKYYLHYSGFNNSFLRTKYRKNIKKGTYQRYSSHQVGPWQVSDAKIDINGVKFTLSRGRTNLHLNSGLLGRHQIGPLALSAVFGMELGLTEEQVKTGVAKTKPFEHRMEPKQLSGGWLIDDTYNGNIEGMKAGLALLKELPAKRKVYITPGLVAQGKQSKEIHEELGREIAKANPDLVVLIKHSITDDIINGIKKGGYKGELRIESDPLDFYTNLKHFVAAGDIILMQNDWPDQYE